MRILILGGAGYIGRVVADRLCYEENEVKIFDLFKFSKPSELPMAMLLKEEDTRNLVADDFADVDVVLDLAAISNDPSGALNPALTREINAEARVRAAQLARSMGVKRHVLFSSCSVYGANAAVVDETSPLNPLTEYARSNVEAERRVLALGDKSFCVSVFRLATVFGPSQSMRFDLVVNTMTLSVHETGRLTVGGGGNQYRPLVHVADVAKATNTILTAPPQVVGGEIFNVVHTNMQMHEVARTVVSGVNRPVEVVLDDDAIDHRDYRVTGAKAEALLGFVAERTVQSGARSIFERLEQGTLEWKPSCIRLNGYRELVARMVS